MIDCCRCDSAVAATAMLMASPQLRHFARLLPELGVDLPEDITTAELPAAVPQLVLVSACVSSLSASLFVCLFVSLFMCLLRSFSCSSQHTCLSEV